MSATPRWGRGGLWSARARLARRVAPLALVVVGGCSLLVDGDLSDVHCVDEGGVGPPACPADSVCSAGLCVTAQPPTTKLGAPCSADLDCGPGEVCLDPAAFGGAGDPVCSRTCCASNECDAAGLELVCWASPAGAGRFCRDAAQVGAGHVGSGASGVMCSLDVDCRSGRCDAARCLDPCCSDTNCAAAADPGSCRLHGTAGHATWSCQPPELKKATFLEPCAVDADCASGLCLSIGGTLRCSMACCESAACGTVQITGNVSLLGCTESTHEGSVVRACSKVLPATAMGAIGTECTADEQCRGGVCVVIAGGGGKMACSDACCTDPNCADAAFVCRPEGVATKWALRCERK